MARGRGRSRRYAHRSPDSDVPPFYDSLMGKDHRARRGSTGALARLRAAIAADARIRGARANLPFHAAACSTSRRFKPCGVDTGSWRGLLDRDRSCAGERCHPWLTFSSSRPRLRDGNQCLWAALGIDTAKTLSIAPVMDRVGFQGHRFHDLDAYGGGGALQAGGSVGADPADGGGNAEYAAAVHVDRLPLHLLGDRAAPNSWRSRSASLARNGIRRFCLADPMNDAEANISCARMVKQARRRLRHRGAGLHLEPDPR